MSATSKPAASKAEAIRKLDIHEWAREEFCHYVEPQWVSHRLFAVESFVGDIWDPACGFGRIPDAARAVGSACRATDIVDRKYVHFDGIENFLTATRRVGNIVSNPFFDKFEQFAVQALKLAHNKVALICLVRRLNAARWLEHTPLARVWLLTPRPSMPPGPCDHARRKAQGGTQDFAWLVWDKAHSGPPLLGWLHRDARAASRLSRANGFAMNGPAIRGRPTTSKRGRTKMSTFVEKHSGKPRAVPMTGSSRPPLMPTSACCAAKLLKFCDGRWSVGAKAIPDAGRHRLVALAAAHGWVKWRRRKTARHTAYAEPAKRLADTR